MNEPTFIDYITITVSILGFSISIISVFFAKYAIDLRKSNLEISLYKNISDSVKNFLEFSSQKYTFAEGNAVDDYNRIKKLLKLEVLNNLEYACQKYLQGKVDRKSFKEYYIVIIRDWEAKIDNLKSSDSTELFINIKEVNSIFKRKDEKTDSRIFQLIIIYIIVFGYLAALCKFGFPTA